MATLKLSEEQVSWFRARRGYLAGPGAASARGAVRAILGAQSQQLPPSLIGVSQRTRARPSAEDLEAELFGDTPTLVRSWGQRDTLFIFDPEDWPVVVSARDQWQPGGRGGPMPTEATLGKGLKRIKKLGRPITRTDLLGIAPKSYVAELAERIRKSGMKMDAERFAASRIIWSLAHRGEICVGPKVGTEQSYVLSPWQMKPMDAFAAAVELSLRYLSTYGPATPQDLAYFFNGKVTNARKWLAAIEDDCVAVECGGRKELVALAEDTRELRKKPPAQISKWPVRMLPLWDSLLMGHADKSWTTPVEAERKLIWRKAAYVAAVVLSRGQIVATWKHSIKRKRLVVELVPLSGWRKTRHAAGVNREAAEVSAHLGLAGAEVIL